MFRHVLSDKIKGPNNEDNKENHGYLVTGTPSQHIVQGHGDEITINETQWYSLFKLKEKRTTKKNPIYEKTKPIYQPTTLLTNRNIGDNFIVDTSLIMLNEEELLELLSEIEPKYDNLITILPILYHSPSTLSKVLKEWYNQREHTNGCPVNNFDDYYEKALTNQWFFALTKPNYLDEKVCKKW